MNTVHGFSFFSEFKLQKSKQQKLYQSIPLLIKNFYICPAFGISCPKSRGHNFAKTNEI